jgi:hypothetical protein
MLQRIGSWAFIVGVVLAVVAAIFTQLSPWLISVLIILGLVIGLLNVATTETRHFLLAALALVIVSGFTSSNNVITQVAGIGPVLGRIFTAVLLLVVPATIVVALRSIYALARVGHS